MTIDTQHSPSSRPVGRQRGLSLVELLVAMTVSLILMAGVIQIFSSSKQTYRSQEANSRIQESGRAALTLLQRDIRPAGFRGCTSRKNITPSVRAQSLTINPANITGYEEGSSSNTPPAALGTLTSGTDVITIQGADECSSSIVKSMGATTAAVAIRAVPGASPATDACNLKPNDIVLVSDCNSADIFKITLITNGTGGAGGVISTRDLRHFGSTNTSAQLSKAYSIGSDVMGFKSFTYYIANGAGGTPSLWRYDNTKSSAQELVANVANMQIEYGIDTSGNESPNFYVDADNVGNWNSVIAVRVSLLVQTPGDNLTPQAQTYFYNHSSTTAGDKRLYRVFTSTIMLRNSVS